MKYIKKFIKINESIDHLLPEEGGYAKLGYQEHGLFSISYPIDYQYDLRSDILMDSIKTMAALCGDPDYQSRTHLPRLVYKINHDESYVDLKMHMDNWIVVTNQYRDENHYFICDGEEGLSKFIKHWNYNIRNNKNNLTILESVDYLLPPDNSYTRVGDTRFAEFVKEYPYIEDDTLTPELKDVMRVIYEKCSDENAHLSKREALCSYVTPSENLWITATASAHTDNWYSIKFKLDSIYVNHAAYYICDGISGLEEFSQDWTGSHLIQIDESVSYLPEGSYSKLDETDLLNFINTYGKPRINLELMAEFKSYLNTNDIIIIDQISRNEIIIVVHGMKIATSISEHTDMWISIVYGKDFYICDQEAGMYELFDMLFNNRVLENASYLPTGLYSEINADDWTNFLLTFGTGDVDKHTIDTLLVYAKSIDIEPTIKSYNYGFTRPNGEQFYASVYKHDDHWISVLTSDRGLFLCDQEDGMIALFRDVLMPNEKNNETMITESIEDDVEDGSYLEIDSDDVLKIWKDYGPSSFDITEIEQLADTLGKEYSINRFEKGNIITIYSHSRHESSQVCKFDDGWFICNNEPDANFLCDQIAGVIQFIKL